MPNRLFTRMVRLSIFAGAAIRRRKTRPFRFLVAVTLLVAAPLAAVWVTTEQKKLTASTPEDYSEMGREVAVSGSAVIVSAPNEGGLGQGTGAGAAYIFERDYDPANPSTPSPGNWGLVSRLARGSGYYFGTSVALDGSTAVVGARHHNSQQGAAYVYDRDAPPPHWDEVKVLAAPVSITSPPNFGSSVGVAGDLVAVGANREFTSGHLSAGAVHLFKRDLGGLGEWGEVKKIVGTETDNGHDFGWALAFDGSRLIVGSPHDPHAAGTWRGAAYIFDRDAGGLDNWGQVKRLVSPTPADNDEVGFSVALSGDTVVVGSRSGGAHVFQRDQGGAGNWGWVTELTPLDTTVQFGRPVALAGDLAIVSASGDDDAGAWAGAAYVFHRNQGGANNWGQRSKFSATDTTEGDGFGSAVAIYGGTVVVGIPLGSDDEGAAYIFEHGWDDPPTVAQVGSTADTGDGEVSEDEATNAAITALTVTFSESVQNPPGDTEADDVTNPANYLLLEADGDGFQTVDCATGADSGDTSMTIDTVAYDSGTFKATLGLNGGVALPDGEYRLLVCGTTSILDGVGSPLDGNADGTEGDDFTRNFLVDRAAPTDPGTVASSTHVSGGWANGTQITVEWSGGADTGPAGLVGYSVLFDTAPTTLPDDVIDQAHGSDPHSAASPAFADGTYYFHLRTCDLAGNCTTTVHRGPYGINTVGPSNPTALASTSHVIDTWSSNNQITTQWSGASDAGPDGVGGYSVVFDTAVDTIPDTTLEVAHGADPQTPTTSAALADGAEHYFHLRTCDAAGNCAGATHLGPFKIDTVAPSLPTVVQSTSHTGAWSTDDTIDMQWWGASDAHSGVDGYSVVFGPLAGLPDQVKDMEQDENPHNLTSDPLADGAYYFRLATVDAVGNWSASSPGYGPYRIDAHPPNGPSNVLSTTHTEGATTVVRAITMTWTTATDTGSGLLGYWHAFTENSTETCGMTQNTWGPPPVTSLSRNLDNGSWYFHICAGDNSGLWAPTVSVGPYIVSGGADIEVTQTDSPDPVQISSNLTYTITIRNNGPLAAENVWLSDQLWYNVGLDSVTPSAGTCTPVPGEVFWQVGCVFGTMASGETRTIVIEAVTPGSSGTIENYAVGGTSTDDGNGGNNSSSESTTVQNCPVPTALPGENRTIDLTQSILLGEYPPASGGTSPYTCGWDLTPAAGAVLDDYAVQNPRFSATATGGYTAELVVTDSLGCISQPASTVITVDFLPDLDLYNIDIAEHKTYERCHSITAEKVRIVAPFRVVFRAGSNVELGEGFTVDEGAELVIEIDPAITCP